MEFNVKIWKNLHWAKKKLIIYEEEGLFEIKSENPKKQKDEKKNKYKYSLDNALILDQSKNNDIEILIATKDYKQYIKTLNEKDKKTIIEKVEEIIKKITFKNAYKEYNDKIAKYNKEESEMNPKDYLCCKIFFFKNLLSELNQKIESFKSLVKPKPKSQTENEIIIFYNSINNIKTEMEKNFGEIINHLNTYFDLNEKYRRGTIRLNSLLSDRIIVENSKIEKKENDSSSDEEKSNSSKSVKPEKKINNDNINENLNINENINIINEETEDNHFVNSQYSFLSYNKKDFKNEIYNYEKRKDFKKVFTYPQNIIKEMIQSMTQKKAAPVYFNEPLSMGQKQCEKFYYLDLLSKASQEKENKSLQLGYICAFIIGEIFLSLSRNLKPFNPIIGETYEYFINEKNFRYYSEQVKHNPQITAFIGETPEFALYGDTKNSTSFKILKGAMELSFKNKVHLHLKTTNEHFVYMRPNVLIKGFLKPPLRNDYSGTITIENETFPENKAEIKFMEESWTNSVVGLFEGKIYSKDEVIYLIKGNWNNSVYLLDNKDNEKKIDLLNIDPNQEYLKNGMEGPYKLPTICYDLNFINKNLEKSIPPNDSRQRKDMRFLEECPGTSEAQIFKEKYEEKQRKELNNDNHKILFFEEKGEDKDDYYYIPNGKYWEMRKSGKLLTNDNSEIFDVTKYF